MQFLLWAASHSSVYFPLVRGAPRSSRSSRVPQALRPVQLTLLTLIVSISSASSEGRRGLLCELSRNQDGGLVTQSGHSLFRNGFAYARFL